MRPVGALAWWSAVAIAVLTTPYSGDRVTPAGQVFVVLWVVIGACLMTAAVDGVLRRRPAPVERPTPAPERQDVHTG